MQQQNPMTSEAEFPAIPDTDPAKTEIEALQNLDEVFSRDPLDLSKQDINLIVSRLRAQRKNFAAAETKAKAEGKKRVSKKEIAGSLPKNEKGKISDLSILDIKL